MGWCWGHRGGRTHQAGLLPGISDAFATTRAVSRVPSSQERDESHSVRVIFLKVAKRQVGFYNIDGDE